MVSLTSPARAFEERALEVEAPALKVLAVIDGSERTSRVIACARVLRGRGRGLQVVVLAVVPEPATGRLRGYGSFKREEVHGGLRDAMSQRAVSAVSRRMDQERIAHVNRVDVGDPAATILKVAREEDADLILLGDGPPGLVQRALATIGLSVATVASQVIQSATVPVVVVK